MNMAVYVMAKMMGRVTACPSLTEKLPVNFKFDDADLVAGPSPLDEIHEQRLQQMAEMLAAGTPVTLVCNGAPIITYYPSGGSRMHLPLRARKSPHGSG